MPRPKKRHANTKRILKSPISLHVVTRKVLIRSLIYGLSFWTRRVMHWSVPCKILYFQTQNPQVESRFIVAKTHKGKRELNGRKVKRYCEECIEYNSVQPPSISTNLNIINNRNISNSNRSTSITVRRLPVVRNESIGSSFISTINILYGCRVDLVGAWRSLLASTTTFFGLAYRDIWTWCPFNSESLAYSSTTTFP